MLPVNVLKGCEVLKRLRGGLIDGKAATVSRMLIAKGKSRGKHEKFIIGVGRTEKENILEIGMKL